MKEAENTWGCLSGEPVVKCVTCRYFLGFTAEPFCYKLQERPLSCDQYSPRPLEDQFTKYLWYSLVFLNRARECIASTDTALGVTTRHLNMLKRISEASKDMLNTVAGNIARREVDRLLKHG